MPDKLHIVRYEPPLLFATGFTCSINQVINCRDITTGSILFCAGSISCCVMYSCRLQAVGTSTSHGRSLHLGRRTAWLESKSHSWFCNQAYLHRLKSSVPCTAGQRLVQSGRHFYGVAQKIRAMTAQCQHWYKQDQ